MFYIPLNLPFGTDLSVIKIELMKRRKSIDPTCKPVTVMSVEPLDWGTPQNPQVIKGWIKVTFKPTPT